MPPAARVADKHLCPCPSPAPHVGGPIDSPASPTVHTNNRGQARGGDPLTCVGASVKNFIVTGSATVEINGKLAARLTDRTMHPPPGVIFEGSNDVEIGGPTKGVTLGNPDAGKKMCEAAAKGRKSGRTQQSYQNCGVEATRQVINQATGKNISEDALLDDAMDHGDATRKWKRADSGGTQDSSWPNIAGRHGVGMHKQDQNLQNLGQAVGEGKGVVTAHDVAVLWGPTNSGGHAVTVTGMEFDANGNPKTVIYNDTGVASGNCGRTLDAATFGKSNLSGFQMAVTDNPIF